MWAMGGSMNQDGLKQKLVSVGFLTLSHLSACPCSLWALFLWYWSFVQHLLPTQWLQCSVLPMWLELSIFQQWGHKARSPEWGRGDWGHTTLAGLPHLHTLPIKALSQLLFKNNANAWEMFHFVLFHTLVRISFESQITKEPFQSFRIKLHSIKDFKKNQSQPLFEYYNKKSPQLARFRWPVIAALSTVHPCGTC